MAEEYRDASSRRQSTIGLIAGLPSQIIALVKAELTNIKLEVTAKAKKIGIGVALFAVAAAIAFFALGVLIAAAVLGLATVLPGWLSALIVAVALLLIAGVCVFIGIRKISSGAPPLPQESFESIERDVHALAGKGDDV